MSIHPAWRQTRFNCRLPLLRAHLEIKGSGAGAGGQSCRFLRLAALTRSYLFSSSEETQKIKRALPVAGTTYATKDTTPDRAGPDLGNLCCQNCVISGLASFVVFRPQLTKPIFVVRKTIEIGSATKNEVERKNGKKRIAHILHLKRFDFEVWFVQKP